MLKDTLERLKTEDAVLPPPASALDVRRLNGHLQDQNFPAVPDSYLRFLDVTDGLRWNGVDFHGVRGDDDGVASLLGSNAAFARSFEMDGVLLLGRGDEEFYLYDADTKEFCVIDAQDLEELETFSSFDALFEDVIGGRLEGIDALGPA